MIRRMHSNDPLDREIHFTGPGVRGKYARDFARSRNVRILAPDLLDAFPSSESMNEALRAIVEVAKRASAPAPKAVSAHRAAAPKSRKKARS